MAIYTECECYMERVAHLTEWIRTSQACSVQTRSGVFSTRAPSYGKGGCTRVSIASGQ